MVLTCGTMFEVIFVWESSWSERGVVLNDKHEVAVWDEGSSRVHA